MCAVGKTMPTESSAASKLLSDPIFRKRLDEKGILEVLGEHHAEFTTQDILDCVKVMRDQLYEIIHPESNYSMAASVPEPDVTRVSATSPGLAFSREDQSELAQMFSEVVSAKAASSGEGAATVTAGAVRGHGKFASTPKASGGDDALASAQQTYDSSTALLANMQEKFFEAQMQGELGKKDQELREEIQRILALVRSGKVDAVYLLVLIAKVNSAKNGLLFTQYGKRLMNMNLKANDIMKELQGSGGTSATTMQVGAEKLRQVGVSQQFLITDMQKITGSIETTLSTVKAMIDDTFKTRLQIVNAFGQRM